MRVLPGATTPFSRRRAALPLALGGGAVTLPAVYGVLDWRGLQVQTVADGHQGGRPGVLDSHPPGEVALINGLPHADVPGRARPGTPALAVATAELSGCPLVRFSTGGRRQPALASVSGSQIVAITRLP